jgi:hypothetical protein
MSKEMDRIYEVFRATGHTNILGYLDCGLIVYS